MTAHHVKTPDTEIDFTLDWAGHYLAAGEAITADLGWTVSPDLPDGLVILTTSTEAQTTTAQLAGGRLGDRYLVTSAVMTDHGRAIHRSLTIRIAHT